MDTETELTWQPLRRSTVTGHRVSLRPGYRPVETRRLGFWAWLAEIPLRQMAKSMATEPDNKRWFQEERDDEESPA